MHLILQLISKSVAMASTVVTVPRVGWYYGIYISENTIQEITTSP